MSIEVCCSQYLSVLKLKEYHWVFQIVIVYQSNLNQISRGAKPVVFLKLDKTFMEREETSNSNPSVNTFISVLRVSLKRENPGIHDKYLYELHLWEARVLASHLENSQG